MRETDILAPFKFVFILLVLSIVCSCSKLSEYDSQQIKEALADSILSTTESWDIDMNLVEDGSKVLNLIGSHAFTIKKTGVHESRISGPVFISIFSENGQIKSTVECDSATFKPDEAVFEMFGNVKVITNNGNKLSSDFLMWERKIDRVSTDLFVTFISPPDSITAIGFFGNSELTEYTLNQASGNVVID